MGAEWFSSISDGLSSYLNKRANAFGGGKHLRKGKGVVNSTNTPLPVRLK